MSTPGRNRGREATRDTTGGQLGLPLGRPKTANERDEAIAIGRRVVTARFVRHPRARHYVLRVLATGVVRVTLPRYGSRADALAFLRRQLRWIDLQRYAAARTGAVMLVGGELVSIAVEQSVGDPVVRLGSERIPMRRGETARAAAVRYLRQVAQCDLPPRLHARARDLGLQVERVTVRNQQTRWGSCSANGTISLNWRLLQMPDAVRDYVLVHELMHLREDGHGRRFWHLVEEACPQHREARRWLKAHQGELA